MEKITLDVLFSKVFRPGQIISVGPDELIPNAAKILRRENVGLMIVIEEDKLVGVVSERDIVQRWVGGQQFPKVLRVRDIMTKDVEVVTTSDTVFDCYLRFLARNCRHLPVLDPFGNVVGVLSMRDVVKVVINDLEGLEKKKTKLKIKTKQKRK